MNSEPVKILFVCHGNICRSPMAEFVMKEKVRASGLLDRIAIASAATSDEEIGAPIHSGTRKTLLRHNVPFDETKRARRATPEDYRLFSHIVAMESVNIANLAYIDRAFRLDPDHKVSRLLDYTPNPRDVDDPWYHGDFERTWREIDQGCDALLEVVKRSLNLAQN